MLHTGRGHMACRRTPLAVAARAHALLTPSRVSRGRYHCVNENYKEQITCKWDTVSSVLTNKAFGKHKIPYSTVDGGVVPTLKHKFFETDLPFGLCTFVDIARMIDVDTPLIDAMIRWNQGLIGKEYMTASGKIDGADAGECVLPSALGLTKTTLEYGNRSGSAEPPAKKAKQ